MVRKAQKSHGARSGLYGVCYFVTIQLDSPGSVPGRGNEGIIFVFATTSRRSLGPSRPRVQ
jgi:hypothetical protein